MSTATRTDMGIGLGVLFSLLSLAAAVATAVLGYVYALNHAAGEAARATQVNAGLAFGLAILAGCLAVTAFHVHGN